MLPADSLLMLYTDGVTESFDPENKLFGHENAFHTVRAVRKRPPAEICDHLLETLRIHRAGKPTVDDVTVMAIKVKSNEN